MADDSEGSTQAKTNEDDGPEKIARYVEEIELYDKETQKWDRQAKRIIRRYKDDRGGDGTVESQERRFNYLWSLIQNLKPELYARNPKPDIQRRFKDDDPVGRIVSDVLERSASFFTATDHFFGTNEQCVVDYSLVGRGTLWVRYVPHFKDAPIPAEVEGQEITDDVGPGDENEDRAEAPQVIDYEEVIPDYVHRKDFGHNICRTWDEVWLVWRAVYLTRKELVERFGKEKGDLPPLDYKKQDLTGKVIDDGVAKSVIYEAWDKIRRCAIWFHKTIPEALDYRPDPLRLNDFFPCPRPLLTNLANDSLIPTPDYVEYQDQASELDLLTARISMMTRCLKVVGVYDASVEGLNRMFNEGTENELIPIQNWANFQEKGGGIEGAMSMLETKQIAETLLACYEAREKVKADLDEITGMADIVRGATDPGETASAQKLKASYANQRIGDRQREVQRFVRETIRIMVDIICNHFQIETIKQISGVRLLTNQEKQVYSQQQSMMGHNGGPPMPGQPAPQPPPLPTGITPDQMQEMLQSPSWEDIEQLLRDNAMRSFRVDIETDSTIKSDESQEKQDRVEFLKAFSDFMEKTMQAGAQDPDIVPLAGAMLQFGVRAFPVGKELESAISTYIQKKEREAANPQPKPNPEMMKVQGELQLQQAQQQGEQQTAQAKAQADIAVQHAKVQADLQVAQGQQAAQAQQAQQENQMEMAREQAELAAQERISAHKVGVESDMQWRLAQLAAAKDIVVALISAKTQAATAAQEGAEAEVGKDLETPDFAAMHNEAMDRLNKTLATISAPKRVVRDGNGMVSGIETVPQNGKS
jgi:hypothetical protein